MDGDSDQEATTSFWTIGYTYNRIANWTFQKSSLCQKRHPNTKSALNHHHRTARWLCHLQATHRRHSPFNSVMEDKSSYSLTRNNRCYVLQSSLQITVDTPVL